MPSPNRRRLLRAVGAVATGGTLAGCTALNLRHPDATPTADPPDGFWRWVSVEATDGPPAEHEVGWDVTVTQPWATVDRSPRLASTVTNEADAERFVGPPLPGDATAAGGGLHLREEPAGREEPFGVWCVDGDGKRDEAVGHAAEGPPGPLRLAPGASTTWPVVVLDDRDQRGCLRAGVYDFELGQVVPYAGERSGERAYYDVTVSLGVQGEN